MQRNFKVLVVDDDDGIREGVQELLEMEGCEVETAPEGKTAIEKLIAMKRVPDLIFLDLNMPVMSGHEFLKRQKMQNLLLAKIPVIVMTAVPDALVDGVAGLLRKPMEIGEIIEKLNEFRIVPIEAEISAL